jgi:hypothetical protein
MPLSSRLLATVLLAAPCAIAQAHGVAGSDGAYLRSVQGVQVFPLMYLGAKHMVTGYDHLLYLAGVVFFLHRLKDVALSVTLFAAGHSVTLLWGVLGGVHANPYAVDAIIGLSVVYKALENIGALRRMGVGIDPRLAVLEFGLAHGLGLATKLQEFALSHDGIVGNMLAFNAGVELGQFAALAVILVALQGWRRSGGFGSAAYGANVAIMSAGIVLFGQQVTGLLVSAANMAVT